MEPKSEKQFNTNSTYDTFDEIYTNYDVSVNADYSAGIGYPFDYPIRWLNDPSMNKRIAIRRLEATPSSHSFKLGIIAEVNELISSMVEGESKDVQYNTHTAIKIIDITYAETLIKVMNMLANEFSYDQNTLKLPEELYIGGGGRLIYNYSNKTNRLEMKYINSRDEECNFHFTENIDEFLRFLNQPLTDENRNLLKTESTVKVFNEVWNRDRLHFHASFSTSRRHFIGKRGDFYQNLTLLYPQSNETTFTIRFTSDGYNNILLRYCEFDIQLCFIVNYMKSVVL